MTGGNFRVPMNSFNNYEGGKYNAKKRSNFQKGRFAGSYVQF